MTSQGSAQGRFRRAIQRRHLFAAEMTVREMDYLSLANALALTLLIGEQAPDRCEYAAVPLQARQELLSPVEYIARRQESLRKRAQSFHVGFPPVGIAAHILFRVFECYIFTVGAIELVWAAFDHARNIIRAIRSDDDDGWHEHDDEPDVPPSPTPVPAPPFDHLARSA